MQQLVRSTTAHARVATYFLILATALVFTVDLRIGGTLTSIFGLWPIGFGFRPWQVVTYAFIHASYLHLIMNMVTLWLVGPGVEQAIGLERYVALYFLAAATSALAQLVASGLDNQPYPTIGASGAVFGIWLMYVLLYPRRSLLALGRLVVPAWILLPMFVALEFWVTFTGKQPMAAHAAHLGGLVAPLLVAARWRASARAA